MDHPPEPATDDAPAAGRSTATEVSPERRSERDPSDSGSTDTAPPRPRSATDRRSSPGRRPEDEDPLLAAQLEIRDLKAAVVALREELEAAHASAEERMREGRARAEAEARQLQGTIVRLREELERATAETRERVGDAERVLRDEIEQHRNTIRALREQLEARAPESRETP